MGPGRERQSGCRTVARGGDRGGAGGVPAARCDGDAGAAAGARTRARPRASRGAGAVARRAGAERGQGRADRCGL
ncbi:hypothetical protein WR25_18438 [Diploscapter pachys]|uniref:Uncharacterized protein n=1 Tax=Diploscapter pachys TaxID=2018661 RepID=A0A2A2M679_9BILA|nr:hypothetical protein WR25_18438 [Diploscapter pachys]